MPRGTGQPPIFARGKTPSQRSAQYQTQPIHLRPVIAKAGNMGCAMDGTALFWIATAELIGEGAVGPYNAAVATAAAVAVSVTLWRIARHAADAGRGRGPV